MQYFYIWNSSDGGFNLTRGQERMASQGQLSERFLETTTSPTRMHRNWRRSACSCQLPDLYMRNADMC